MSLHVYLVKWKKDTNPHYPGLWEAMDVAEARVVASSKESASEYVMKNKKGVEGIVSVEEQELVV